MPIQNTADSVIASKPMRNELPYEMSFHVVSALCCHGQPKSRTFYYFDENTSLRSAVLHV